MYTHFGDRETVFTYTGTAHVLIKVSCSEGKKKDKGVFVDKSSGLLFIRGFYCRTMAKNVGYL